MDGGWGMYVEFRKSITSVEFVMNVVLLNFCSNDADDDGSGVDGGFS